MTSELKCHKDALLLVTEKYLYIFYIFAISPDGIDFGADCLLIDGDSFEYEKSIMFGNAYKAHWNESDTEEVVTRYRNRKQYRKINPEQYLTHQCSWLRDVIKQNLK